MPPEENRLKVDPAVYEAAAHRRNHHDALLWQAPAMSLTGQAFLFTIALDAASSLAARLIASILSLVVTVCTMTLMARSRQAEMADTDFLVEFEKELGNGKHHGPLWSAKRNAKDPFERNGQALEGRAGLHRLSIFWAWFTGLATFGFAALVIILLALCFPDVLSVEPNSAAPTRGT